MNEFISNLTGTHSLAFHFAGLFFAIFGSIIYKYHSWNMHKRECEVTGHDHAFSLKFWVKDNWLDMTVSLVVSFVAVRFIDIILHWLNPKLDGLIGVSMPVTEDQIAYYLIVAIMVQWAIHKYYRR